MSSPVSSTGSSASAAPSASTSAKRMAPMSRGSARARDREPGAVAEVDGDDRLHRGLVDDLGQRRGRAAEDDDRLDAGVVELVGELARGVERVHVHLGRPRAVDAKHRDREGEHVRAHQRHTVAALHPELLLQPGGDGARSAVDLGIGHGPAEALEGRLVGEARHRRVEERDDRGIGVRVDLERHIGAVGLGPGSVHGFLPSPQRGSL